MHLVLWLFLVVQSDHRPKPAQIEISVVLDRSEIRHSEGTFARLLLLNDGPRAAWVPRRFPHGPGYPGFRVEFRSAHGKLTYMPAGDIWPEPREIPHDYQAKSILLDPGDIYGSIEPIAVPEKPGCYQLKVLFYSWADSEGKTTDATNPIMLGDYESPSYKICVRGKSRVSKLI
jgi:hypothetical protein